MPKITKRVFLNFFGGFVQIQTNLLYWRAVPFIFSTFRHPGCYSEKLLGAQKTAEGVRPCQLLNSPLHRKKFFLKNLFFLRQKFFILNSSATPCELMRARTFQLASKLIKSYKKLSENNLSDNCNKQVFPFLFWLEIRVLFEFTFCCFRDLFCTVLSLDYQVGVLINKQRMYNQRGGCW